MQALKWTLTAWAMLAVAGCAGVQDDYLTPYGPGTPTPLPNTPGRGVWNPPAVTSAMTTGSGNVLLYNYVQPFPTEAAPAAASLTNELPSVAERSQQERELVETGNNQKSRMQKRLENDRR